LPPRRGSEGKFLTVYYYSSDGSNYIFISSGKFFQTLIGRGQHGHPGCPTGTGSGTGS
jgi:hypothetical protein